MKIKKILLSLSMILGLISCGVNGTGGATNNPSSDAGNGETTSSECNDGVCGGDLELNLDAINDYLANDPNWALMNENGNKVALIPFTHINGPKAEWNFFALVNFEYNSDYVFYKYQVTYLSCTCRTSDINYWQTAYVELSCPLSGKVDDVVLRRLSFDYDGTGQYLAGFWGDSGVTHAIPGSKNITYEDIKTGFIPYLVGKTYNELSSYDNYDIYKADGTFIGTYDDVVFAIPDDDFANKMEGVIINGEQVTIDTFNGASVSTNNILRMVLSLMEYHAANNI